jgi:hypothetical protein
MQYKSLISYIINKRSNQLISQNIVIIDYYNPPFSSSLLEPSHLSLNPSKNSPSSPIYTALTASVAKILSPIALPLFLATNLIQLLRSHNLLYGQILQQTHKFLYRVHARTAFLRRHKHRGTFARFGNNACGEEGGCFAADEDAWEGREGYVCC